MRDPHIQDRGFFGPVTHPVLGSYEQGSVPFTVDGDRPEPLPAPTLGQHNSEVYCAELGLDRRDLETLAADGVV